MSDIRKQIFFTRARSEHTRELSDPTDAKMHKVNADTMERLLDALKDLVEKLDECKPHIDNAFFMTHELRGGKYDGPTYEKELKAANDLVHSEQGK